MVDTVVKVINSNTSSLIEHPAGLYLTMDRGVFSKNSKLTITNDKESKLKYASRSFQASSDEFSVKPIEISMRLQYKPESQSMVPFIEIKEEGVSYLLPGKIQEKVIDGKKEYYLVVMWEMFKNDCNIIIGDGKITDAANIKRIFHPVQHQFKIHQDHMEKGGDCDSYVFSWTKVPGTDDEKLREFVRKRYHIDWVYAAEIAKSEDDKTISMSGEDATHSLTFNNEDSEVILKIDNIETDKFIARTKNGEINIYSNSSRRNDNGKLCEEEPQNFYPACYPASWASLCNSYRMTPKNPRRIWETGTPTERNPPPNEFGDFFATWTVGTNPAGNYGNPPPVTWVTDWRANLSNPTQETVVIEKWVFPETTDAKELKDRAVLIRRVLLSEVGGHSSEIIPHPVRMQHSGHAWVIVGVDGRGFWDHALADDSWSFSSYCLWEQAPWLKKSIAYGISFPARSWALKPEERRLGCVNLEGSSDCKKMKRVRFWDVHTGLNMNTINWTPHTETDPGYLWIRGKEPLTCHGFPQLADPTFDSNLGHTIPQPLNDFGNCANCRNSKEGCQYCRLRLLLPFWVHNTTLDEKVTYKVDLLFWNKYQRWVSLNAKSLPETSSSPNDELHCGFSMEIKNEGKEDERKVGRWIDYRLPGPLPGECFSIQALMDTKEEIGRSEPWNSQGFAWYVDFHKDQLKVGAIHGIRLVLTCTQRSSKPICLVQDVKQIWFKVGGIAPY